MKSMVQVNDLRRHFGPVAAVDGLSFSIPEGSVVGMVGANGAGKTTTLRILATLEHPDSGTAEVGGYSCVDDPVEVRRLIGWMPDNVPVSSSMLVIDYLDFFARASGLRGAARSSRLSEVLAFTDLEPLADRITQVLSKGQRQRLSLARTLIHDPQLLILDEPAAGLDPKARVEFRNLVHLLRQRGKTLIISSHILSELGEMCDFLVFVDAGRVVFSGTASELARASKPQGAPSALPPDLPGVAVAPASDVTATVVDLQVVARRGELAAHLASLPGCRVVSESPAGLRVEFADGAPEALAAQLRALCELGFAIYGFAPKEVRLEDAFIEVLKRQPQR